MTFRRAKDLATAVLAAAGVLAALQAQAEVLGKAVVPTEVIYPGDPIGSRQLEEVDVTNPNLAGDYAKSIGEVSGLVSKRTLLPGRTDPAFRAQAAFCRDARLQCPPDHEHRRDDHHRCRHAARRWRDRRNRPGAKPGFRHHRQRHRS